MNKRIVAVCALSLFTSALCVYFLCRSGVRQSRDITVDAAEVLPYLRDGDVICRLGDRVWSSFVRHLSPDDRRFSHVGIVRIRGGKVSVVNAECLVNGRSESVNEVTLSEFLEVARAVGVYRANFMEGSTISDDAVKYLGRPFDWKFNHEDDSEIYCTELLHIIIKRNAPEHSMKTARLNGFGGSIIIPLEAISKSVDFDEVLYIGNILSHKK